MIETKTRIVSVSDGTAWVAPTESSGCGSCGSRSSCAVSGLARHFSRHQKLVPVPCDGNARPGEELTIAVTEGELLKAGLMAYLLPSILAVAGTAVAAAYGLGNPGAVAGMAGGIALGLLLARLLARPARLRTGQNKHSTSQGDMT